MVSHDMTTETLRQLPIDLQQLQGGGTWVEEGRGETLFVPPEVFGDNGALHSCRQARPTCARHKHKCEPPTLQIAAPLRTSVRGMKLMTSQRAVHYLRLVVPGMLLMQPSCVPTT